MLITDGQRTISVSKGAYHTFYKPLGFTPATPTPVEFAEHGDMGMDPGDETMLDDLYEKPLSEMDFNELKMYARALGISTNGIKSKQELRQAIKEAEQDD